jgi:hypothetical protein
MIHSQKYLGPIFTIACCLAFAACDNTTTQESSPQSTPDAPVASAPSQQAAGDIEQSSSKRGRTYAGTEGISPVAELKSFEANGVSVTITHCVDSNGADLLAATFTPVDDGFHLYGMNLDTDKTDGIGMPTLFAVQTDDSVMVDGQPFDSVDPVEKKNETLGVTLPVYPEGPVTLYVPIVIKGSPVHITASVTYMACQDNGVCLNPVMGRQVDMTITEGGGI